MTNYKAEILKELIEKELLSIPIENWGFFYPCQVAIWRYIELNHKGSIGELNSGYDSEPYFKGKGSEWFCDILFNSEGYLSLLEEIMYFVVNNLSPESKKRGFLLKKELPKINFDLIKKINLLVFSQVNEALKNGGL